jgi:hypothetical protein
MRECTCGGAGPGFRFAYPGYEAVITRSASAAAKNK